MIGRVLRYIELVQGLEKNLWAKQKKMLAPSNSRAKHAGVRNWAKEAEDIK